jgi:H+/Cl- antiporter ClcA
MPEPMKKPNLLRLAAAVILGIVLAFIIFLILALVIGVVNDMMGMNVPISLKYTENLWSAILLVVLIVVCVSGLCWKVRTTPPSTSASSVSESEE